MFRNLTKLFLACLLLSLTLAPPVRVVARQKAVAPLKVNDVSDLARRIQVRFLELRKDAEFPGVNIGIVWGKDRAMSVSVGFSDLENEKALKPTDRMLAGSIGKTYVSAVTLQLVEEGKLDLDAKVFSLLSVTPLPDSSRSRVPLQVSHGSSPKKCLVPSPLHA